MAINAELQKWLAEKVTTALTPEEQQTFNSILGKEAVSEQLNRAWMAPPDYNRKMDELKTKEAALNTELQNHIASLNQWRDGEQGRVNQQVSQLQAQYDRDVAALRQQIEAEGLQPSVAQPAKPNGAAPTNGNGSKSLSPEDVNKLVQAELSKAIYLPAVTAQIIEQHRQLYGAVPDMVKVTDAAYRSNKSLVDTWREMYKVGDKEAEIQQAAIQKKIDDGIAEGMAKRLSDGSINQTNFGGRQQEPSVIRRMIQAGQEAAGNSPLAAPAPVMQHSEALRAANEAWSSGKYEVKQPGQ